MLEFRQPQCCKMNKTEIAARSYKEFAGSNLGRCIARCLHLLYAFMHDKMAVPYNRTELFLAYLTMLCNCSG
jgi:hypothetical protein